MSSNQQQQQQTQSSLTINSQQLTNVLPNFAPKKCWICLNIINLDESENKRLKDLFFVNNSSFDLSSSSSSSSPSSSTYEQQHQTKPSNASNLNYIKLEQFTNKYVLAICKCRKKLAHLSCFNSYIDLKQNGNSNVDIYCTQCNYKYLFDYPYNGKLLRLFDFIDQFYNYGSSFMTGFIFVASIYWSSFSYGALTLIQIYGFKKAVQLIKNNNIIITSVCLPSIPVILVASRYFSWQKAILKCFPNYFKLNVENTNRKMLILRSNSWMLANNNRNDQIQANSNHNNNNNENQGDEETDKDDAKILYNIRLAVGGLMLPTIATTIDHLLFKRFKVIRSTLLRTILAGLAYTVVKGIFKIFYKQKVVWQQTNREILNYKEPNIYYTKNSKFDEDKFKFC